MFCKFFAHDLRHGLGDHPCRLGVGFLLFFCLSSYHFLTLRIYELTNPEFFETPVTTGDYFLALTGGCGKVESVPGGGTTFTMPVLWITFVLWILFASLYYPFLDLQGMGKQLLCLSGTRGVWWASKCLWTVCNTVANYLLAFAASVLAGICFGAVPSMTAHVYLYQELEMNAGTLTSPSTWDIWPLFFLTALALVVLSLLQLALSVAVKPLFSYLLLTAYLLAGTYLQSPALLGNFAMPARSSLLATTGLDPLLGGLLCLWVIVGSVLLGWALFEKKDILGGDGA